jgi:mRNA interferase MazF
MINRGEILLLSFPFTDLQSGKVRPGLVISSDSFNKTDEDAVFILITSKEARNQYDLRIDENHPSFQATGLKVSSTFRTSKIMCLDKKLARRRLGYADKHILEKVDSALLGLLDLHKLAEQ